MTDSLPTRLTWFRRKMGCVELWVVRIQIYHLAVLRIDNLSSDTAEDSVKVSASTTIVFPLFLAIWATAALFGTKISWESIVIPLIVGLLIVVLGLAAISDKIYDRNIDQIRRRAGEIREDSRKGRWWAGRRLLTIYIVSFVIIAVLFLVISRFVG